MKSKLIICLITLLITASIVFAAHNFDMPSKDSIKRESKIDEYLDTRLHFTREQKTFIKQNRQMYRKEMEATVKQMQSVHDEIRNVYMTGIPKYQADFKTATKKAQLVVLKQNIRHIKEERKRAFESVLDKEQKAEFEKIKKEFAEKRVNIPQN